MLVSGRDARKAEKGRVSEMVWRLCALLLGMALAVGCNRGEEGSSQVLAPGDARSTAPQGAPQEALLIGLIPEHRIFKQIKRYEPLANYLSKKIGRSIELKILTRYGNIIDNFVSLEMDGAFFGSFTYALAHEKLGIQVLARPESVNGVSTYHGLMFVRNDSGIANARDMEGKTFVFVDKATTAGFLLPLAYFRTNGIVDYKSHLREAYFAGTHEDAIADVLSGRAHIGAAKNTVFDRLASADASITEQLLILERSPAVPENALAVRRDMDESLKRSLKESLIGMEGDPEGRAALREFGAKRFIETTDADYAAVFEYANTVDLDLSTYDYVNE